MTSSAERVLVLTPTGRDGQMVCGRIVADGMPCEVCADLPALLAGIASGAAAAVVAQEALSPRGAEMLLAALEAQEPWSDIPVLLLAEARSRAPRVSTRFFERANVVLLPRPLRHSAPPQQRPLGGACAPAPVPDARPATASWSARCSSATCS